MRSSCHDGAVLKDVVRNFSYLCYLIQLRTHPSPRTSKFCNIHFSAASCITWLHDTHSYYVARRYRRPTERNCSYPNKNILVWKNIHIFMILCSRRWTWERMGGVSRKRLTADSFSSWNANEPTPDKTWNYTLLLWNYMYLPLTRLEQNWTNSWQDIELYETILVKILDPV